MGDAGWRALGGSFLASAGLTVSASVQSRPELMLIFFGRLSAVLELALPNHLRHSDLRRLRREPRQWLDVVLLSFPLVSSILIHLISSSF